jgi:hypothetical protein
MGDTIKKLTDEEEYQSSLPEFMDVLKTICSNPKNFEHYLEKHNPSSKFTQTHLRTCLSESVKKEKMFRNRIPRNLKNFVEYIRLAFKSLIK